MISYRLAQQGAAGPGRGPEVAGVQQGGGDVRHVPEAGQDAAPPLRHHEGRHQRQVPRQGPAGNRELQRNKLTPVLS